MTRKIKIELTKEQALFCLTAINFVLKNESESISSRGKRIYKSCIATIIDSSILSDASVD